MYLQLELLLARLRHLHVHLAEADQSGRDVVHDGHVTSGVALRQHGRSGWLAEVDAGRGEAGQSFKFVFLFLSSQFWPDLGANPNTTL